MWILGLKGLRHIKREKASLPVDVCLPKTFLLKLINSELKQLRRRPQRRLQKTIGLMIKTTPLHVRHAF